MTTIQTPISSCWALNFGKRVSALRVASAVSPARTLKNCHARCGHENIYKLEGNSLCHSMAQKPNAAAESQSLGAEAGESSADFTMHCKKKLLQEIWLLIPFNCP
jgi:hypothetical protein